MKADQVISPTFTANVAAFFGPRTVVRIGNAPVIWIRDRFYFSQIRIDPANDQRVYLLGFALLASDDGGKTFREDLSDKLHPDMHALAIQNGSTPPPKPPKPEDKNKPPKPPVSLRLIVGNDGGVYQSYAGG